MKIVIAQPKHEKSIEYLESILSNNKNVQLVLMPEGYLSCEQAFESACKLAKDYGVVIVTSYINSDDGKNRAVIIDNNGEIVLERRKTPKDSNLIKPSVVRTSIGNIGIMLCREIFLDFNSLKDADMILNPIGVGMFSVQQFLEWSNRAKYISKCLSVPVIGTSHADGYFKESTISIPISFYYDKCEEVFLRNDKIGYIVLNMLEEKDL